MNELSQKEWETLSDLLERVADMQMPTWQEKREVCERNLSQSGNAALGEICAWFE